MAQTPTTWLGRTLVNPDTTGFQGEPEIIGLSNGNILVVFSDDSATAPSAGRDIVGVIYDAEGNVVRAAFQVNTTNTAETEQTPSIAATNDGGFIMVYEDNNAAGTSIRAQRYDAAGTSIDSVTVKADPGAAILNNPIVAVNLADNSFFVTYEQNNGGDNTILGRKFDSTLTLVGAEVALRTDEDPTNTGIDGDPLRQDTAALTGGGFVTVFDEGDINTVPNPDTNDTGIEFRLSNAAGANGASVGVTGINGIQDSNARVAGLSDGGFVVTWLEAEQTGGVGNNNIKYRVYEANGTARTGVLTAVDSNNNHSGHDVIGLEDGTFFIIWEDNTFNELEGQLYNGATGATIGSQINVETLDTPNDPQLGTTTDGRILVTYQTIAGNNNVHYEIFDPRDITITADPGDGQVTAGLNGSRLIGSTASESLLGQGGNDLIIYPQNTTGSGNVDTIDGGGGVNTFQITTLASTRIIDLTVGVFANGDINSTGSIRGTLANIQNVTVAGAQDVRGNASANVITATGNFANVLEGLGGNDTLNGGAGIDEMRGGADNDTYFVDVLGDIVDESLPGSTGIDTVRTSTFAINLSNAAFFRGGIENVTLEGVQDIGALGNGLANTLIGNSGNNGLDGAAGADTMRGLAGNDRYIVDNAGDTVDEAFAGSSGLDTAVSTTVSVDLSDAVHFLGDIEQIQLNGALNLNGTGNGLFNAILGNSGNNVIDGRAGGDTMRGLGGNDSYTVDSGSDIVDELFAGSGGIDTVFSSAVNVNMTLAFNYRGDIENIDLDGALNLNAFGNGLGNTILGNAGNNNIGGGGGTDIMTGDAGDDTFVFNSAADSAVGATRDRILDFEDVGDNDSINLSGFAGVLAFVGGAAFTAANQVRAVQSGADVLIQINTVGAGGAESEILLANTALATVTAGDFLL